MDLKTRAAEALYTFYQYFYCFLFKIYFRWELYGLENVPTEGGAILAVNHQSALDPPLAGSALRRKIWYLGRKSLIEKRFVEFAVFARHIIPITRGKADLGAAKAIVRKIRGGEIVLMFPEGTRSIDGALGPGREGIGMFISHARSDVIPCCISGSRRALTKGAVFPRPRKIRVAYGSLMRYEEFEDCPRSREGYRMISEKVMERIAALKRQLEDGEGGVRS